jgi:hypothetical protein
VRLRINACSVLYADLIEEPCLSEFTDRRADVAAVSAIAGGSQHKTMRAISLRTYSKQHLDNVPNPPEPPVADSFPAVSLGPRYVWSSSETRSTCQIRSANTRSTKGISSPSALAVSRLMTNSNLVDCCTGRSAGLAPLRMLPV